MKILNEAFEFLTGVGVVTSQEDFSSRFLSKSPRYYAMLKATGREPSVEAIATLASRMVDIGRNLKASRYGNILNDGAIAEKMAENLWNTVYRKSLVRGPHVCEK